MGMTRRSSMKARSASQSQPSSAALRGSPPGTPLSPLIRAGQSTHARAGADARSMRGDVEATNGAEDAPRSRYHRQRRRIAQRAGAGPSASPALLTPRLAATGRSGGGLVQLHHLADGCPEILPRAAQMGMHGEGPTEELGGLAELSQHEVAESLAGEGAEVVGIARERLPAVRDRRLVVLGDIAKGRALVPPFREGGRFLDEAGERGVGGGNVLTLHRVDALGQEAVEARIARAVPHRPEGRGGLCRLGDIVSPENGQCLALGHQGLASHGEVARKNPRSPPGTRKPIRPSVSSSAPPPRRIRPAADPSSVSSPSRRCSAPIALSLRRRSLRAVSRTALSSGEKTGSARAGEPAIALRTRSTSDWSVSGLTRIRSSTLRLRHVPSRSIPSRRCSGPMDSWRRLRASSVARTIARRAPSVNRSTILPPEGQVYRLSPSSRPSIGQAESRRHCL